MLEAKKASVGKKHYTITEDGRPLTTWDGSSSWKTARSVQLEARRFMVRANRWGNKYGMVDQDGVQIASAGRVGRQKWTAEADGHTYQFQCPSMWRPDKELYDGGRRVGSIRQTSFWRGELVADLPGLPLPVAVFVLGVVLTMWDSPVMAVLQIVADGFSK